jgi:transforming growth factor-beta-induced protein
LEAIGHRQLQYQGERCDVNALDVARDNPDLTTFVQLMDAADLDDLFLCAGPFTILAPTNDAFDELDPALVEDLLRPENQDLLQEVLLYHILPGYQPSDSFAAGPTETLLFDSDVEVDIKPTLMFNNANVVEADIEACNGVIHTIDDVLSPNDKDFCDAFEFSARRRLQDGGEDCDKDVLETARGFPELSVVVSLIEAADLSEVFTCAGPFTALLPNNAAFDDLDPAFVEFLLDPDNQDDLQELLLYHILPGATLTTDFTRGPAETLLLNFPVDVSLNPIQFDDANVLTPDITACNGYIDIIDMVLSPFPQPTAEPTAAPVVVTEEPTVAPTTLAPTPVDICDDFTFRRRFRRLQNGGKDCQGNVLDTAREFPDLSMIVQLIEQADLVDIFSCAGPFTALLPDNQAFDEFDLDLLGTLVEPGNMAMLQDFVLYHILPGATLADDFPAGPQETLLAGNPVDVTLDPLLFDFRGVLEADIEACNGYIDILDGVLNPFETRKLTLSF